MQDGKRNLLIVSGCLAVAALGYFTMQGSARNAGPPVNSVEGARKSRPGVVLENKSPKGRRPKVADAAPPKQRDQRIRIDTAGDRKQSGRRDDFKGTRPKKKKKTPGV